MSGDTPAPPRLVADRVVSPSGYGVAPYAPLQDGSVMVLQRTSDPTLTVVMHLTSELERLTR